MAPEIALNETAGLPRGSVILDPMAGSGVALRFASEQGLQAIGFDRDPLAALMTRVWTTPICTTRLRYEAANIASHAFELDPQAVDLPWIDNDQETSEFVDYWFDFQQKSDLRRLSSLLINHRGAIGDALMIALSRIIITKKRGASLAWDISHSRPHKRVNNNDFSVIPEFIKSVNFLANRIEEQPPPGNVRVGIADARDLRTVSDCSVDTILTSPPYLNAIDYLRGHKFTLVWLGYRISEIRAIRSNNIGSEKTASKNADSTLADELTEVVPSLDHLPARQLQIFRRYVLDIFAMMSEMNRVLRPGGKVVLVIGNSCLKGVYLENSVVATATAKRLGLLTLKPYERELPSNRRYLPPPSTAEKSDLNKRMRIESVLSFVKT
ncbi:MAG TPA: hypothetical protein VJU84_11030 [Pyrinomonadaceae bacterium]|nr:hypothetical protein [Pyrinomonadaceae bacterium]